MSDLEDIMMLIHVAREKKFINADARLGIFGGSCKKNDNDSSFSMMLL